jgi:uncharacterized protein (DUF433 family)
MKRAAPALLAWAPPRVYPGFVRWQDFITVAPGVRSGKPCVVGTRITVSDVLQYLAGGMSEAEIFRDFPSLKAEHIRAVLAFAAERGKRLVAPPTD